MRIGFDLEEEGIGAVLNLNQAGNGRQFKNVNMAGNGEVQI